MAKHIDPLVKQAVLTDVKNGMKVAEVARKHLVSDHTVYSWLKAGADNTGTSLMEVVKLKRENQELKEIIGLFALQKKRAEKNTGHS